MPANQTRMLGRLRRQSRHELTTRNHTRDWTRSHQTGGGQGRCAHFECDATKPYRSYKRDEDREWRRELPLGDDTEDGA